MNIIDSGSNLTDRTVVVGRGNARARLMLIGEAPGEKESLIGKPFVGRSGQLLDKLMIEAGLNINEDVYLCNLIKCRPPNNRKPTKQEITNALPWLFQQIKLIDPWIIALAGSTSVGVFLGKKDRITKIRGRWQNWEGRLVMPIFHPSYLLRNQSSQSDGPIPLTRLDLVEVRNKLLELTGSNPTSTTNL